MSSIQYRFSPYIILPSKCRKQEFSTSEHSAPILDFSIGAEYLGTLCQEFPERGVERDQPGNFFFGVRGEISTIRHASRSLIGFPGTAFRNMCGDIVRRFDFKTQDMSEGVEILRNASVWYSDAAKSLMLRLP